MKRAFTAVLGQLYINPHGRFQADDTEFHHGDLIEVLVYDGMYDSVKWVETEVV